MFTLQKIALFCLAIVLMQACSDSNAKLPIASGKLGSMVLVAEPNVQRELKGLIDTCFLSPLAHLPAGEPFFDVLRPSVADFQKLYYNHKTVLVLVDRASVSEMSELLEPFSDATIQKLMDNPEPKLMSKRNLFAQYQHVVYLFGKDANDLKNKLRKCREEVIRSLMSYELSDQNGKLFQDSSANDQYFKMIQSELGLGVKIPAMFTLKYHNNKTFWFEYTATEENSPKVIALVMHTYPYRDKAELSYESIRSARDTVFKYLIKGELPGTYMGTTESKFYPPVFKENLTLNGNYCTKIRGWWTIRGLSQAGPFVRYVVVSPDKKNLFAFEGFVYKPNLNTKERDLRLIESIALSIK